MLKVTEVAGALGAEVSGIDLSMDLDQDVVDEIRSALIHHRVLVFRGQSLEPAHQTALGERFGDLEDYPFVAPLPGYPKVIPVIKEPDEVTNFGGGWHTDLIYHHIPPMGTMLYALEVPARGGDTLFADGIKAYQALTPKMQAMLQRLQVEYNVRHISAAVADRDSGQPTGNRSMRSTSDEKSLHSTPSHPLVRVHPESGEQGLYFSRGHTIRFEGMTTQESRPLLDWLQQHMTQPVFTSRLHWASGTLAFWDNRCVSHYALNDYHGERRHMHRITIAGDKPIGPAVAKA